MFILSVMFMNINIYFFRKCFYRTYNEVIKNLILKFGLTNQEEILSSGVFGTRQKCNLTFRGAKSDSNSSFPNLNGR